MAGTHLDLEVEGEQEIADLLKRLSAKISDRTTVFQDIGEYLIQSHDERWKQEVSPEGTPWAPLSPWYASSEKKQKSRGHGKILVLGGYLKNLNYQADRTSLRLGTPMLYAATHQMGDSSRGIPARPFLGFSTKDEQEIIRLLNEWISEGINI